MLSVIWEDVGAIGAWQRVHLAEDPALSLKGRAQGICRACELNHHVHPLSSAQLMGLGLGITWKEAEIMGTLQCQELM